MASAQTCSYSSLYKSNNQIYPYTLPPRGSINLAIFLCFIRSWTQYCYSAAKIHFAFSFCISSADSPVISFTVASSMPFASIFLAISRLFFSIPSAIPSRLAVSTEFLMSRWENKSANPCSLLFQKFAWSRSRSASWYIFLLPVSYAFHFIPLQGYVLISLPWYVLFFCKDTLKFCNFQIFRLFFS